jgi:hypothetical protein
MAEFSFLYIRMAALLLLHLQLQLRLQPEPPLLQQARQLKPAQPQPPRKSLFAGLTVYLGCGANMVIYLALLLPPLDPALLTGDNVEALTGLVPRAVSHLILANCKMPVNIRFVIVLFTGSF